MTSSPMPWMLVPMPVRPLRFPASSALAGAVAVLLLPACGATPSAERVDPIVLTDDDGTRRGPDRGARPVELPDPATAGDDTDPPARRESPVAPDQPPAPNPAPPADDDDDTDDAPEPVEDDPDSVDSDDDAGDDDGDDGDDGDDDD